MQCDGMQCDGIQITVTVSRVLWCFNWYISTAILITAILLPFFFIHPF